MSALDRKVKRLQRRNSQSHAFFLAIVLLIFVGLAVFIRLYVFEPVKLMDTSMAPQFKEKSITWMCKIPQCLARIKSQDIVWAKLNSNETQVRNILAMPGDSVEISDKGEVTAPHKSYLWSGEDAFIQSRKIYVPKVGDTLVFANLNDVEQDYIISYLREKGENILIKTTLWQGNREINLERVGSTKIANRQVSLNEIDYLPWQDRYLIEEQIRHSEPGNAPIKLKRQLFHGEIQQVMPQDTATRDSLKSDSLKSDSTKADSLEADTAKMTPASTDTAKIGNTIKHQSIKIFGNEITEIVITDDCFYLVCNKSYSCPDSREMGYFTKNKIIGRHVEWPDRIRDAFIEPIVKYVRFGQSLVSSTWSKMIKFANEKINGIKQWFNKPAENENNDPGIENENKKPAVNNRKRKNAEQLGNEEVIQDPKFNRRQIKRPIDIQDD